MAHLFESQLGDGFASAAQWMMLLQLSKAWRVLLPEGGSTAKWDSYFEGFARLFASLAFFTHAYASLLLAVGNLETTHGAPSWTDELRMAGMDCQECYVEAAYFATIGLTSVGYGDKLVTTPERAINAVMLLAAQLFAAKVCADLTWLVSTHNILQQKIQANRAQTRQVLTHMGLPRSLVERVLAYQRYVATVHKDDLTGPAFAGLSENIIKELRLCAYRSLVLRAPFLREQSREVISLIVGALRDMVFLPADLITRAGTRSRDLYFIRRGTAAVFLGAEIAPRAGVSEEVATHGPGHYFGEIGMLTGRPRGAWVMAKTYCVVSLLPYSAIEQMNEEFPGAFTRLVQSMVKEYNMKASLSWSDVATRLNERVGSVEDAFAWCCGRGDWLDGHEDELSAEAFSQAMIRLKVPELDRKIFWADMDTDNAGVISYKNFEKHFPQTAFVDKDCATPQRRISIGSRPNGGRLSVMSRTGGFGAQPQPPGGSGAQVSGPSGFQQPTPLPGHLVLPPREPAPALGALHAHALADGPGLGQTLSEGGTTCKLPSMQEAKEDALLLPGAPSQEADLDGIVPSVEAQQPAPRERSRSGADPLQRASEVEQAQDDHPAMFEPSDGQDHGQAPKDNQSEVTCPDSPILSHTADDCSAVWFSEDASNAGLTYVPLDTDADTAFRIRVLELVARIDERITRLEASSGSARRRSLPGAR